MRGAVSGSSILEKCWKSFCQIKSAEAIPVNLDVPKRSFNKMGHQGMPLV